MSKFINQIVTGDAVGAKETMSDMLSAKAFEALDARKQELASTLFGGIQVEEEVELEEELNLEDYSLQEQAYLINNCKFLISIHGAGLSNLIFGTKDLTIVEIIEDRFVNVNYWFYSNIIGIKYYYYIGKAIQTEYCKTKNTNIIHMMHI